MNPLTRLLDSNKLKGAENYHEWHLNLRVVLESERLQYIAESSLPVNIDPRSTPEEFETFQKWKDDNLKVKSYILGSMLPDLIRQYIDVREAFGIMETLKKLFQANQEMEVFRKSKELYRMVLHDGEDVSGHVLNMIEHIRYLEGQGVVIGERQGRNLILSSLPSTYSGFVLNYHMNKMQSSYEELHNMLRTGSKT